jgi:hypothetical protein
MKHFFLFITFLCCGLFSYSQHKPLKVYVFIAEKCPISIFMTKSLKEISESYSQQADFYLVFPMENSHQKSASKFKSTYELNHYSILMDKKLILTKKMGATVTPEVIITHTNGSVVYQGRINDAYLEPGKRRHFFTGNDMRDALQLLVENQSVPKPWKPAVGCLITLD